MRKQVTFEEHMKREYSFKHENGHKVRPSESDKTCKDGFECLQSAQHSSIQRRQGVNICGANQHLKTIKIPTYSTTASFLKHPDLTTGQKRYLYSIASVYSTEHMRQQMKKHYLSVLHSCIKPGQNSTGRRRYGDNRGKCMINMDAAAAKDLASSKSLAQKKPDMSTVNSAFGKAIHALSRIGDELWLDPTVKGLAVRSMNSSQSAYGCFLFSTLFFQSYRVGSGSTQTNGIVKCKLLMKCVLTLFRSLTSIERNVDRCQISINTAHGLVVFQFYCKHGIIKTHNLGFQESEALQAVFPSHLCPNMLKAQARLLVDMVLHFPVTQDEITLSTTPLRVHLRNYYENRDDLKKMMHTEMSIDPSEFDCYQIGVDSDITYCLKELRGLLSFAESHGLPVSIRFGAAGKPVCFSVEDMVLEASVVLATLMDLESRGPSQATKAKAPATPMCCTAVKPSIVRGRYKTPHEELSLVCSRQI